MHALFVFANDLFVLFWVLKKFMGTCFVFFFFCGYGVVFAFIKSYLKLSGGDVDFDLHKGVYG